MEKEKDPRVKKKGFEPEKGSYKKSAKSVGELYPVLEDEFGTIDGFHRKEDKPDWHTKKLQSGNLKEHYKKMLHANFQRRIVPEEQMKEWINGIAEELIKEGKEPPLGKLIDEELGSVIAYTTLMRYLDEKYKQKQEHEKRLPQGNVMEKSIEKMSDQISTPEEGKDILGKLKAKIEEKLSPKEKTKRTEERKRNREYKQKEKQKIIEEAKAEAKKELKKDSGFREEVKKEIKEEETVEPELTKETEYKKGETKGKYVYSSGVEWCDYGINIYYGCGHNCKYCYGAGMYKQLSIDFLLASLTPQTPIGVLFAVLQTLKPFFVQ